MWRAGARLSSFNIWNLPSLAKRTDTFQVVQFLYASRIPFLQLQGYICNNPVFGSGIDSNHWNIKQLLTRNGKGWQWVSVWKLWRKSTYRRCIPCWTQIATQHKEKVFFQRKIFCKSNIWRNFNLTFRTVSFLLYQSVFYTFDFTKTNWETLEILKNFHPILSLSWKICTENYPGWFIV